MSFALRRSAPLSILALAAFASAQELKIENHNVKWRSNHYRTQGAPLPRLAQPSAAAAVGSTPGNVMTWHNNNARTGHFAEETLLTPRNVNPSTFGRIKDWSVDGQVYAQPLYLQNVNIPGVGSKNVVYVATEGGSVYAFDADTLADAPLWRSNYLELINAGRPANNRYAMVTWNDIKAPNIYPNHGYTSTPVIDLATQSIYVVGPIKNPPVDAQGHPDGTIDQYIHALDLRTGAEKTGSPLKIDAEVDGTVPGETVGGKLRFVGGPHLSRPGLALDNGVIYVAFSSHDDQVHRAHGWVIAYRYQNNKFVQTGAFNSSPNSSLASFWASGSTDVEPPMIRRLARAPAGTASARPRTSETRRVRCTRTVVAPLRLELRIIALASATLGRSNRSRC